VTELRDRLQKTLGSAYTIERELGGGGMSRVFVAEEVALGRRVVVKVLSPELAAELSAERFAREIRVAAQLQHPNIVPVLAAGGAEGVPYYTMPLVDGLSLRARVSREGALPLNDSVSVLRDVARALAYAHEHGVVHRDIKPENVLIHGDAAVVTDFGIAKAVSASRTNAPGGTLTQVGTSLGTPEYMAPEQATGDPNVDHRADIYSFGCMAYELLAGETPFRGRPTHQIIAAHVKEEPAPLASRRSDVPPALAALVARCLEKDPERRPQSAREVLQALDVINTPSLANTYQWATARRKGFRWGVPALAAAVVVVAAALLLAKLGTTGGGATADQQAKSLVVLPFANVGGDSAQEYLADGITDELTTALGKSGVRIASRNAAYRYKGQRAVDAREVGRALGVGTVLQGSVRRAGNQLRVSAQLSSATDGVELWQDTYDGDVKDVFKLQDDVARKVTSALQSRLGGGAPATGTATAAAPAATQGTSNEEAYDFYLKGQYALQQRRPGLGGAVGYFERAVAKDPAFARAYAGLATALGFETFYGLSRPEPGYRRAIAAARRALELDSAMVEAHVALGSIYSILYRWDDAIAETRRAVAIAPGSALAHYFLGHLLAYVGKYTESLDELKRAQVIDPYSSAFEAWYAQALVLTGQTEAAYAAAKRAWELDSTSLLTQGFVPSVYLFTGRTDEARAVTRHVTRTNFTNGTLGFALARMGDRAGALEIQRSIEARRASGWLDNVALGTIALGLGDTTRALAALERAMEVGEPVGRLIPLQAQLFDPIRRSARFAEIVRRVGLDEKSLTSANGGRPK
jgi:serine/threonine-protein kinase